MCATFSRIRFPEHFCVFEDRPSATRVAQLDLADFHLDSPSSGSCAVATGAAYLAAWNVPNDRRCDHSSENPVLAAFPRETGLMSAVLAAVAIAAVTGIMFLAIRYRVP
jgi:hypothetical protein